MTTEPPAPTSPEIDTGGVRGDIAAVNLDQVDTGGVERSIYDRRWAILGVLCLSLVLVVVGNSSLNVALPTLQEELGASGTQLQWIVDAYSIVFAGLLLPAGALGDRFGRKGALQFGLLTVGTASLLSTFAQNPNQLIATRSLMGAGAAFVMPSTLSILANVFPPAERARAIAIWAGFSGAGAAIGPVLSGFLLEHFSWSSVFLVNVPIVIVALVAGYILVPTSKDPNHGRLDPVGAGLSVVALVTLLYAIIEAPTEGWLSPATLGGFALFAVFTVAFIVWEQRNPHPMLPMSFFRNRRFSVGAATITLTFFCMFGLFFVLTLYLQFVLGYSPLSAGLATLPLAAMLVIFAPRSAAFVVRWGQARVQAFGLTLVAIGMLIVATLSPDSSYAIVALGLVVMGIGMACTTAPATNAIVSSVPLSKSGVGSAVNDTTREVGGALGIAVLGSLVSSGYRATMADQVGGLPAQAAGYARDSVGGAFKVAQEAGPLGDHLNAVAATAYSDAMSIALIVSAVVALLCAGIVLIFFPRTPAPVMGLHGPIDETEPAPGEPDSTSSNGSTGSTGSVASNGSTSAGLVGSVGHGSVGSDGDGSVGSVGDGSVGDGSVGHGSVGSVGVGSDGVGSVGSDGVGSVGSDGVGSVGSDGHGSVGSDGDGSDGSARPFGAGGMPSEVPLEGVVGPELAPLVEDGTSEGS